MILVFGGMVLLFAKQVGGYVEGRLFPVTRDTQLTRIEQSDPGWSMIWGHSVRQRQCSFVRLEWRIGTPSHYSVIDVVFLEGSKVRGDGIFEFGPWKLHASQDQIENRSFATVVHSCHPLWNTETHFFSGAPLAR
ncbi:hypothetical protein M8007_09055 [Dinoroseobacter shibae]|uniref:hypothetical protein n=1 Tax=Dinoroseobacter shibae TaxID=215813 RepID=UPI0005C72BB5|nr:hypothetical protein [Dinoroseobacter shibae]URF48407.1 hypothetical protein M8008_09055 [Dinoroseobacter shibae]URF52717.1 hypothetical protein M8007_09055 [Dinoroseobacter shibae]